MIAYLDTSSLIKLYVDEAGSSDVRRLVASAASSATSSVAYVETRATLAAYRRSRSLTARTFAEATRLFEHDWAVFMEIATTPELLRAAGEAAERYHLRALDAIHLASFQQVLERSTYDDVEFSSFDDRLNRAARRVR